MSKVIIRPYNSETDQALIHSSMPRGIYYGGLKKPDQAKSDWFADCHKYVKFLLEDKDSIIRIACLANNHDQIIGYALMTKQLEGQRIEFVYVKDHYRREGIGRFLCRGFDIANINQRHLTKVGAAIIIRKGEKQHGAAKKTNGDGDSGSQGDLPPSGK